MKLPDGRTVCCHGGGGRAKLTQIGTKANQKMDETVDRSTESLVAFIAEMFAGLNCEYLTRTFGPTSDHTFYRLDRCLIVVCENGDVCNSSLGAIVLGRWEYCNGKVSAFTYPDSNVLVDPGGFENVSKLKVYVEAGKFVIGERYGENALCRRIGEVADLREGAKLEDFTLTWVSHPEPGFTAAGEQFRRSKSKGNAS